MIRISINLKMNLNIGKNEYSRNMTKIYLFLPEKRAGTKRIKIRADTNFIFNENFVLTPEKSLTQCSATATIRNPASLSKLPNGCQGHPRFYPPPPDRSPIMKYVNLKK